MPICLYPLCTIIQEEEEEEEVGEDNLFAEEA